ncbi:MAG: hypothetical protein RL385_653 [Pseudomonadota bacterium]|jgi:uncharacterized protein YggE
MHIFSGTTLRAGAALAFAALTGCAHHAQHGHTAARISEGGIVVSGAGEVRGVPDIARFTAGVEVRATAAEEATAQAAAQMEKLLAGLVAQGVAESDLKTEGYSVSFEADQHPPAPVRPLRMAPPVAAIGTTGTYVVSNTVGVTVRRVAELGKLLGAVTSLGASNVWGISFDIADKEPLLSRARGNALSQARARAEQIATLAGLSLGPIVSIQDGVSGGESPMPMLSMRAAKLSVPVQQGELTVDHQVRVQYAIAGKADCGSSCPHSAAPAAPGVQTPAVQSPAVQSPAVQTPVPSTPAAPLASAQAAPVSAPAASVGASAAPAGAAPAPAAPAPKAPAVAAPAAPAAPVAPTKP